ncbi:hypothetical protein FRC00_001899 [Tulasnella sp. 408]|nr:hypothetical protein FRC00_001899 [Tulasnella sp. 408]
MQPDPRAAPADSLPLVYDDYTIDAWPSLRGYAYSELPDASLYKLVRVETRDPTGPLVSRRDRFTGNVAVLVDVSFRFGDIVDKVTGRRQATYQLVIQQAKILKSPPLGNSVYQEDLEPRPRRWTLCSRSHHANSIEMTLPTKRPIPSSSSCAAPPGSRSNAEPAPPPSYEADEETHSLDRFRQDWVDESRQRQAENAEVPEDVNDDGAKEDDDVPMTSGTGACAATIQLWDGKTGAPLGDPLTGHSHWIRSVAFSPDGRVLASGSHDYTVRLWDGQTRALLGNPLAGHSHWITSVAFSPDGKVLASGSRDQAVRLWDGQTGAPLGDPLTGHSHWITSVAFSPDGKVLASGSYDCTVRLWDSQTGAPLGGPLIGHSNWIRSVAFSPNGKVLASGSDDRTVRLWDGQTGAPLGDPLTGHSDSITSVAFLPNGKILASGSNDRTVRLWDGQTGAPVGGPLTGHSNWIRSVAFSPDGKVLASGSDDRTVRLWDGQTGEPLGDPLTGHSDSITSVAFSPGGKVLASVSQDGVIRFWDHLTLKYFLAFCPFDLLTR